MKIKVKHLDLAIEILFLSLIFLLPTIFDRRIGIVFSLTKATLLRIVLPIILMLWSLKLAEDKKSGFVRTVADWPILSYLLAVMAAGLMSVHPLVSWIGFYGRYEGVTTLICYGLLFFVATNYVRSWEQIKRGILVVVCSSSMMALYGFIQRSMRDPFQWGGVVTWERVIGTIGQPNFFAAYLNMAFFLILGLLLFPKKEPENKPEKAQLSHKAAQKAENPQKSADQFWDNLLGVGSAVMVQVLFFVLIYSVNRIEMSNGGGLDLANMLALPWHLTFFAKAALSIYFAFNAHKIKPFLLEIVLIVSLLLNYIAILFTQSRGGYLGLVLGFVIFFLLAPRKFLFERKWGKYNLVAVVFAVMLVPTLVIISLPQYSPFNRFSSEVKIETVTKTALMLPSETIMGGKNVKTVEIQENRKALQLNGAAGSRIETWKSAVMILADNPMFGIGPEVLKMIFPRYETELFRFKEAFHVKQDRCHNSVMDVSVTRGLISWTMYLWLLITIFWLGIKNIRRLPAEKAMLLAAILGAILSYKIQNQFSFGVVAIGSLFWIMLGWVAREDLLLEDNEVESKEEFDLTNFPWFLVIGWIVAIVIISWFAIMTFMGDLYFKDGRSMMDIGRVEYLERANSSLGKSVDWFPYEIGTYTHWGIASLNLAQMHNFSASEMAKSIDIFKLGNAIDPYNADNLHLLGKIYLMNGMGLKGSNSELAKQAFITSIAFSNKAIKVDPYYAEVYFNRGMAEEFLGQENLALADYEITFMINPSLNMAMDSMQKLYTKQGRPQDFLKVLDRFVKRYPENPIALGWVGDWFMNKNLPASALAYYEKAYKYDNNNRVVYYNLINAKIENGQGKEVLPQILEEVQKDFGSDMAHFTLAHYYFRAGDKVQAREQLEETLRLNPNNTSAQNLLKTIK